MEGGHLGLGSVALTALKESEGPWACQKAAPRLMKPPAPHATLSNQASLCPNLVLAPLQGLNSRAHYSSNIVPIIHQHLDKEEKWACRSEPKHISKTPCHWVLRDPAIKTSIPISDQYTKRGNFITLTWLRAALKSRNREVAQPRAWRPWPAGLHPQHPVWPWVELGVCHAVRGVSRSLGRVLRTCSKK